SITASAFIARASSSRNGDTSDANTWAAPAARATPIANSPIGPQPVTAMLQPESGPENAVGTALPQGSITAATSSGMPAGTRQQWTAGTATYSAKPPFTSTPRMRVFSHTCELPVRQAMQVWQTMWLSQDTRTPGASPVTPAPSSRISPTNSCPSVTGGR